MCVSVLILSSTKWLHHLDWPTECACHRGSQVECLTISQRSPPTLICSSIHCTWSGWESSLRSHHEARWFGVLAGPWDWASAKPHAGLPNLEKPLKTKLYSLQFELCQDALLMNNPWRCTHSWPWGNAWQPTKKGQLTQVALLGGRNCWGF